MAEPQSFSVFQKYGDMGIPYIDGSVQSVNEEIAVYSATKAKE